MNENEEFFMVIPDFGPCASNADPSLPEEETKSGSCSNCDCEVAAITKPNDRLCLKCKT